VLGAIALLLASRPTTARQAEATQEYAGVVSRVVDGDTIIVGKGRKALKVRLRCIDTPEVEHRERRAQPFGAEAQAFTRAALSGQHVRLRFHKREPRDRYDRLLAYVFLDDDTLFNAEIVRRGLARVSRFKCLYKKQMKALEAEAMRHRRGIWHASKNFR